MGETSTLGRAARRLATAVGAAGVALATAAALAPPAHAGAGGGQGEATDGGYGVGAVSVSVSGDYSPGLRASVPAPPPLCWWEPVTLLGWQVDPSDPEAVKKYYDEEMRPWLTGHASAGQAAVDYDRFAAAIAAVAAGRDITWYSLRINDALRPGGDGYQQAAALHAAGCGTGLNPAPGGLLLETMNWFETGNAPEPVVDPEILAEYAYEVMDLVDPTLDWNPKIGEVGNASLVNLPTWLWVDDEASVGVRTVTASVGAVSATVTARTDGVSITSPAGTTECSADQARTAYSAGASEASACTLTFDRASWGYGGGFPVEASTTWQATWTSSTGEGGQLDARSAGETTYVPVAESQSLVTAVD
ncbi:hypothetical protein [Nocardioides perillae]|uniref:Uncharacterized protein n=1 Tax=Nocardioides perillae TaxID=1119534 RepID=A0A7Y9RR96_9ACTN|nr:hypothetical protein [Nocardioides perillae]NYG55116.1 hypothetical protein [Nocardioides perillae]